MGTRLRLTSSQARGPALWVALCVVLLVGTWVQPMLPPARWDWQPLRAGTEPWRWWTAAFVHWSPGHRLANSVGLVLVALLGWRAQLPLRAGAAWLAAWPLTHGALLARPDLVHYGGLSGVLHAGVAVAALTLVMRGRGLGRSPAVPRERRRPGPLALGVAMLAALALKLLLEQPWGPPLQTAAGWSIALAPAGHLGGVLAGLLCTAVLVRRTQRRVPPAGALDACRTSVSSGPRR